MAGSNIFIIYTDGNGNVTLSPRQGQGEFEPEPDTTANVTLLEGSGVQGDKMVANILCSNCHRWNGGSTDFSSSSGDWIHASRPGNSLESTDLGEELEQHNDHGSFTWTYTSAQGGQDVNPFVSLSGSNGVSTPPQGAGGDVDSNSGDIESEPSYGMVTAHGTLASIAVLVILPVGAIVIRTLSLSPWIHAGIQMLGYVCFATAASLGIYIAHAEHAFVNAHPIIGLIAFFFLTIQPFAGVMHHKSYKKTQQRMLTSYVHIWAGRLLVVLGMINGGLGIKLAGDVRTGYKIAYGVVAGVIGVAYVSAAAFGEIKRRKTSSSPESNDKATG